MSIESTEPVEALRFDNQPRFDSFAVKDVIQQESKPSLGEYAKLQEIRDWMSTNPEKRFSESAVESAVLNLKNSIDEDRLKMEDSITVRSLLILCNYVVRDFRENPNGTTRTLLENLKVHGLARALADDEMKAYLEKNDYRSEAIDYAVTSSVLGAFFEVVNYNQQEEPGSQFSQN